MSHESPTLRGQVKAIVRDLLKPPAVEARVATAPDSQGRVYVTSRALTGTGHRLGPFAAGHLHRHDGETLIEVAPGDRVWLTRDESGDPSHLSGWDG